MENGEPGMLDLAAARIGGYSDVVEVLSATLREEAGRHTGDVEVAVCGHGGRDTNCGLAVVEAAVRCGAPARVRILTCSWPDDSWEAVLQQYLHSLRDRGALGDVKVELEVLKFGQEPEELLQRLQAGLGAAHLIVQCEQGADLFVEPTGEWLQDNFEDYFVHACCLALAEARGVPVWLLQTNADLDLCRGIDAARVRALLGALQTRVFDAVDLVFPQAAGQSGADPPRTFTSLCTQVGAASSKRQAFRELLGLDLDGPASAPGNLYTGYMCFAARATDAALPVAGVMELAVALCKGGHALPWSCGALPDPQWVLARCLLLPDVAVLTEIRRAELGTAPTYAGFLGRWMFARHARRGPRVNGVAAHCRHAESWWSQLELGRQVATTVRRQRPDLELWAGGPAFVTAALERVGLAAAATEELESNRSKLERLARAGQPSFGALSPNFRWVQPHLIHIFDFALRLLSAGDLDAEYELIAAGLPAKPAAVTRGWPCDLYAGLLTGTLVGSPPA